MNETVVDQSSFSIHLEPYLSALLAFSISRLRISTALLFILYKYSLKPISFYRPQAVFYSPQNITSISCYNFLMISFSSQCGFSFSTSIFALTNSSSSVSSTVILQFSGLQYMRNWMKWKRFLLYAAFLSKVQRLYIFMYSFSVIFLSSLQSNSHSILSTSLLTIFMPIFFSTSLTSNQVKYLFPQQVDSQLNTLIRYFSSVGLILSSSSFSSMVFCFSALRACSFCRSKLSFLWALVFSFSKMGEFLYFCCRWTGRSLQRNFFLLSSLLFQNIIDYNTQQKCNQRTYTLYCNQLSIYKDGHLREE